MVLGNPDFDAIASTTLKEYARSLANNVFEAEPYMFWLQDKSRIRQYDGGEEIVEPLIHGLNDTVETYNGYDTLTTTAQEGITSAVFPLRQTSASISISGREELLNSGSPEKVIDLLEAKIMQARESVTEFMDEQLTTSDGTGNSNKDWLGVIVLCGGEFRSRTPVIGNIDAADALNVWWRSNIIDGGWAEADFNSDPLPAARALTLSEMRNMYNTISNGTDHPDLIMGSQAQYENYEALLQPQQHFRDAKMADAGFTNLLYKGVPFIYDANIVDEDLYFLNSKYIKLRPARQRWFETTPFIRPYNQDAKIAQILMFGNQTINNRKRQGVIGNLST